MSFEHFELDHQVLDGVRKAGYTKPTPIQTKAIPLVMQGRDVMGLAQTGTGKTAAFVLPILHSLLRHHVHAHEEGALRPKRYVRALIIAPTRELSEQINDSILVLGEATGLKSMTVYGGASMVNQTKGLKTGVDIVVACPGRLLDHMGQGNITLKHVEVLVLDEADRMLDMGFMPDIRRIMKHVPEKRQTLLFSATMPDDILELTRKIMKEPAEVQVDHLLPVKTVTHALYPVEKHLKTSLLIGLLKSIESDSVLIFTRTKAKTQQVAEKLQRKGFRAAALQGDMAQGKRMKSIQGFREGTYNILVATDIAARGVDISSISHVINYDVPDTAEAYTHRVGRTGRAERSGTAFTLVTQEDAPLVRGFERQIGLEMELCTLDEFDYDAPPPATSGGSRHTSAPRRRGAEGRSPKRGRSAGHGRKSA